MNVGLKTYTLLSEYLKEVCTCVKSDVLKSGIKECDEE